MGLQHKMIELHVWGSNSSISIISPECLASSWLLNLRLASQGIPFRIVTSSNTNLSESDRLPLLLVTNEDKTESRYEGFQSISQYISINFNEDAKNEEDLLYLSNNSLPSEHRLLNSSLISFIQNKIHIISQYNLYINTKNYEKYTRKLFQNFFPFPMMYNQPLKFYHGAQREVQLLGLNSNNPGFFSISGSDAVAQTEYFNDEIDDDDETEADPVAISSLHEKQLLAKSKRKDLLKESKNSLKCLNLVNEYIDYVLSLYKELGSTDDKGSFSALFSEVSTKDPHAISSSELLLFAYMYSLCFPDLPDKFIYNYLALKYPDFLAFVQETACKLNESLYSDKTIFREPQGIEVPNLWNELKYSVGYLTY